MHFSGLKIYLLILLYYEEICLLLDSGLFRNVLKSFTKPKISKKLAIKIPQIFFYLFSLIIQVLA